MEDAIDELFDELQSAEKKHPGWPENIFEQIAIIAEELGELSQAALDDRYNKNDDKAGEIWDLLQPYIIPGKSVEAYSILRERFPFTTSYQKIKNEVRQVAAMGLRFILQLPDDEPEEEI